MSEAVARDREDAGSDVGGTAPARPIDDLLLDFLLLVQPHLPSWNTRKGARVRDAYRRLMNGEIRRRLDDGRVPLAIGKPGVALQLHAAVLDLCRAAGIGAMDLIEQLNKSSEDHAGLPATEALSKMKALLAAMFENGLLGEASWP